MDSPRPSRYRPGPDAFRALAHPLRLQLLGLLRADGVSTATRLAERLDVSSGLTSYHLRQLAEAGFVEEDVDRGTARDRWWRASHDLTSWAPDDVAVDEETHAMAEALIGQWQTVRARAEARFGPTGAGWPEAWRRASGHTDLLFRVTPKELTEIERQVMAVLEVWVAESNRRRDGEAATPDGAETVFWFHNTVPVDDVAQVVASTDEAEEVTGHEG